MLERIGWEPLEGHRAKARVTILYWIVHNLVDIPVANHLTQAPTSEASSFIRTDFGVPACFLPWQYRHVKNNLPSDICSGLRSSRQTSRPKDSSKFLYIYSHLLYSIQSSSDIVQDPTRVSRTVCVWLNVSTTPGKGAYMHRSGYLQGAGVISTSDAKLGELFLKGVDAFCFCNLIWDDVPQACAVGEDSALVCQSRRVWYAELGIAVPSACRCLYDVVQCQDVNKTMNYSVHHGDAGLRAAFR